MANPDFKVNDKARRILEVLLNADQRLTGLTICDLTGLHAIHPELASLEANEWVESAWATQEPLPDRPRRRLYQLTPYGRTRALHALGRYETP
ncbi:PadR family transcriptional regulator [Nonomuraea turcica]|uniref:PadR family transcriptional regulator n=1 Tax=Nonomuraea sp. G32 TaxID=3067274 RepID=UPI00273C8BF7|nr:helix-turn-helix transcriptional regulator [Nonomuraea sp. G32]MDP4501039.1 helix-turn-helix transcriptional regulator [Nonomuraea sp. G32]